MPSSRVFRAPCVEFLAAVVELAAPSSLPVNETIPSVLFLLRVELGTGFGAAVAVDDALIAVVAIVAFGCHAGDDVVAAIVLLAAEAVDPAAKSIVEELQGPVQERDVPILDQRFRGTDSGGADEEKSGSESHGVCGECFVRYEMYYSN